MTHQSQNELLKLRFVGGAISPRQIPAGELADILKSTETLVVATVLKEHPKLTRDDLILGLTQIEDKSLGLMFLPSIPQIIVPEFRRITGIVNRKLFDLLPYEARDAVRKIATFTRKRQCVAEFRLGDSEDILATVDADLVVPASPRLHMQTTIYGKVVNAGGKNPNVHIETLQGQVVICKGTQEQVKQLAGRLYTNVGIVGSARCDVETLEYDDVEIKEILPYDDSSITDAVRELGQLAASSFADVDADEYVRALRGEESEE